MATRLIGTDSANPRLPMVVITATQGYTRNDLAPGDVLADAKAYTDQAIYEVTAAGVDFADNTETIVGTADLKAVTPAGLAYERPYKDVRTGGVVGDGTTNDGPALNALLSANAGKVIVIPAGLNVNTTVQIVVPSNTILFGYGAKITNNAPGIGDVLLNLSNASNVTIKGVELDGNKAGYATSTEQRSGIYLANASNVHLENVTSHDNKGDGLYIGHSTLGLSTQVHVIDCVFRNNHRNNVSVICARDVKFVGCTFNNASGAAPQSGVDIEPNEDDDDCEDIQFVACTANGNAGKGFLAIRRPTATGAQRNWGFYSCTASGNTSDGFALTSTTDVRIRGGSTNGNGATGVAISGNGRGISVEIDSTNNSTYGLLHSTGVIDGLSVGGTYWHNGAAAANTYEGIYLGVTSGVTQATILPGTVSGGPVTGARQKQGLRVQTGYKVVHNAGYYPNNVTGPTQFAAGVAVEGFYTTTPIAKPAVTGAKGANAALTSLLTQLAALGLITDSTTA